MEYESTIVTFIYYIFIYYIHIYESTIVTFIYYIYFYILYSYIYESTIVRNDRSVQLLWNMKVL